MSAIAVYFVFSYRLWRKPSHHIEVEDKVFCSLSYILIQPFAPASATAGHSPVVSL